MLSFFLTALESDTDRQTFASIYNQHHSEMENAAIKILKNQSDAEDAVQNAFMQVIRHFEKIYQIPCNEWSFWLISIVKNEAYMILRKQKRIVLLEDWVDYANLSVDVLDYVGLVELFTKLTDSLHLSRGAWQSARRLHAYLIGLKPVGPRLTGRAPAQGQPGAV